MNIRDIFSRAIRMTVVCAVLLASATEAHSQRASLQVGPVDVKGRCLLTATTAQQITILADLVSSSDEAGAEGAAFDEIAETDRNRVRRHGFSRQLELRQKGLL